MDFCLLLRVTSNCKGLTNLCSRSADGTIVNDGRVLEPWEWRAMRAPGQAKGEGRPWYAR